MKSKNEIDIFKAIRKTEEEIGKKFTKDEVFAFKVGYCFVVQNQIENTKQFLKTIGAKAK